jgi:hypothetical protein
LKRGKEMRESDQNNSRLRKGEGEKRRTMATTTQGKKRRKKEND